MKLKGSVHEISIRELIIKSWLKDFSFLYLDLFLYEYILLRMCFIEPLKNSVFFPDWQSPIEMNLVRNVFPNIIKSGCRLYDHWTVSLTDWQSWEEWTVGQHCLRSPAKRDCDWEKTSITPVWVSGCVGAGGGRGAGGGDGGFI